ncbi:aldehyde oxidase GLOX1-like [Hibiscus syriacus]|uniref:aldehyde oxidase GLOX1-like n=1 Tax=Hibiscus syriacus TaxID=106335 RepID=UPI00192238D6|nr:aldehyde oxidase GLOX1-like [Hibiscus syriacus]
MVSIWRGFIILPLLFVYGNCQGLLFPNLFHHFGNPMTGFEAPRFDGPATLVADDSGSSAAGDDVDSAKQNGGSSQTLLVEGLERVVEAQTTFKGSWELFVENSGVSAMHLVLLPKIDQALIFDATVWKKSKLKLPGPPCRKVEGTNEEDCWCHSILLDVETGNIKPLRIEHDTWCSSGALDVNGRLISTGGFGNGSDTVRILDIAPNSDWIEYPGALGNGRWYATQVTLADGQFMVFGGRGAPTYEFVPSQGQKNTRNEVFDFKFLVETHDPPKIENNLYPFVYLSTDGNLFIFANNRSVLLNPNNRQIVHEFPVLPNGARNYPASGSSCLLPIILNPNENRRVIPAEVLVCGGTAHDAYPKAEDMRPKVFVPGNTDCARMDITKRNGKWKINNMPSARLVGDAVVLPTGDVLLVNGAKTGAAGFDNAREPNLNPVLYKFKSDGTGSKFTVMNPSNIPRMYHSSFAVLPDGKIMIAGSNTNPGYMDNVLFPTEVRVEKFSPHYLDPNLAQFRQEIVVEQSDNKVKYGQKFTVQIRLGGAINETKLQVTIYSPPFTTHGVAMNQRLVQLGILEFNNGKLVLQAPMNGNIAPPGYYMLFVNYNGVPCRRSMWIQIMP